MGRPPMAVPAAAVRRVRAMSGPAAAGRPRFAVSAVVLGAPDARLLARFYERLLGWPIAVDQGGWVMIRNPGGGPGLSFQTEANHVAPVWPPRSGEQQMMMHLDIGVEDLGAGVAWALRAGAELAEHQPQDDVRVMVDPAGHPFCLFERRIGDERTAGSGPVTRRRRDPRSASP